MAKALYSASTKDLLTVGCFFDFQDMRESPMKIVKPVTLRLVSMQPPQSLLEYALKCRSDEAFRNKP